MAAIRSELAGVQPSSDLRPTAEALLKGEEVPATEVVKVLEEISKEVEERVGGGGESSGAGSGPGSSALAKALAPVISVLEDQMARDQVSLSDLEKLIGGSPDGAEVLDEVKTALGEIPAGSPLYDTAQALLAGKEATGAEVAAVLEEIAGS
jgi:hypothetical protein